MMAFLIAIQTGTLFWPVTVSGWVTLLIALVGVAGGILSAGKFLGTLNGFGVRLGDVEKTQGESFGHRTQMQRQIDRILDQHETMLSRLGEAKHSAEKCGDETVELGISIGSKIDAVSREVAAMNLHLSQRLKAVETILKLKGE